MINKSNPLGPRINQALQAVGGSRRPYFAHVDQGGCGFIAICSTEQTDEALKALYEQYLDSDSPRDAVYEFEDVYNHS